MLNLPKNIKFFLMPYYIPDNYSPEAIALSEGLKKLGHNVFSNIDYWFVPENGEYLFREDDSDYDIAIYDSKYLYHSPKWTINRVDNSKINVLIDRNDWLYQDWRDERILSKFDVILVDNMLKGFKYPDNVKPWAIGVTNRIISYLDGDFSADEIRKKRILTNARVPHNLRKIVQEGLGNNLGEKFELCNFLTKPIKPNSNEAGISNVDIQYSLATAGRHNPIYYKLLNQYLITNAVGGYYEYRPFFTWPFSTYKKILRKFYYFLEKMVKKNDGDLRKAIFVFQYDSFRFWEVMRSHSCPIHLDFDYWGFILPVQPINGEHYLGIKELSCKSFSRKLNSMNVDDIRAIGEKGRDWCIAHYGPVPVSERLLLWIEESKK